MSEYFKRRWLCVIPLVIAVVITTVEIAHSGSYPTLNAVASELTPEQRIRIRTMDFQFLRGYFAGVGADMLYWVAAPGATDKERGRLRPDSLITNAIDFSQIDVLWTTDNHGIGRGLLFAGGTALAGIAMMFAANPDTIEEGMAFSAITTAAVIYAFYKGASGTKETLVYARYE